MSKIIKNTFILTAITLVSGVLLGLVYEITKEPIATAKEAAKNKAYQSVLNKAESFEALEEFDSEKEYPYGCVIDEVVEARSDDNLEGYIITVTNSQGYGGDIQISVGISLDGTVKGIEILSISETAGLGMNANTDEFKSQYAEKNVDKFVVTKKGASVDEEIDAISGATVTSNAVTNAVNTAIIYFNTEIGGSSNE